MATNPQERPAEETFQVEVVNDVSVILRIKGKIYGSGEPFEMIDSDLSTVHQMIGRRYNQRVGELLGIHAARALKKWHATHLDLYKDRPLVFAWTAFNTEIKTKTDADLLANVGSPPVEQRDPRDMRTKIMDRLHKPIDLKMLDQL